MKKWMAISLLLCLFLGLGACGTAPKPDKPINLYGEEHGIKSILDEELDIWQRYYREYGMRHLFIEWP